MSEIGMLRQLTQVAVHYSLSFGGLKPSQKQFLTEVSCDCHSEFAHRALASPALQTTAR